MSWRRKKVTAELHGAGKPRTTIAGDDRNIVRALWRKPTNTTVSDISNDLHRTGVKESQTTVPRRQRTNIEVIQQHKEEQVSSKSSGTQFYGLMKPWLTSEGQTGEIKGLSMIPNIQGHTLWISSLYRWWLQKKEFSPVSWIKFVLANSCLLLPHWFGIEITYFCPPCVAWEMTRTLH